MDAVRASLEERDLLLFVADVARGFGEQERKARGRRAQDRHAPVFLVLNKIDLVKDKALLLPLIEQYKASFEFADYMPVSASPEDGLDELMKAIVDAAARRARRISRRTMSRTSRSGSWPANWCAKRCCSRPGRRCRTRWR